VQHDNTWLFFVLIITLVYAVDLAIGLSSALEFGHLPPCNELRFLLSLSRHYLEFLHDVTVNIHQYWEEQLAPRRGITRFP
jgi:hypothetical protein